METNCSQIKEKVWGIKTIGSRQCCPGGFIVPWWTIWKAPSCLSTPFLFPLPFSNILVFMLQSNKMLLTIDRDASLTFISTNITDIHKIKPITSYKCQRWWLLVWFRSNHNISLPSHILDTGSTEYFLNDDLNNRVDNRITMLVPDAQAVNEMRNETEKLTLRRLISKHSRWAKWLKDVRRCLGFLR